MQEQFGAVFFGHSFCSRNDALAAALRKKWAENFLRASSFIRSEPVCAKNEILVEVRQYVSGIAGLFMRFGSKGKEIAGRKEAGCFFLSLCSQWHVDNHFVSVKI